MMKVRLWVDGEDYGTMSEKAAKMYQEASSRLAPQSTVTWEEVDDDAPDFLPPKPKDSTC